MIGALLNIDINSRLYIYHSRSQLYVMCKGTTVCSRQTLMPSNNIQLSVSVQHNLFPTSIYCMSVYCELGSSAMVGKGLIYCALCLL